MSAPKSLSFFIAIAFSISSMSQTSKPVEYLSAPGPIVFNQKSYTLSWSSHPTVPYFKQEYLVKGDKSDRYSSMLMLEVLTGAVKVKDIVDSKIEELKSMKPTNPFISYELMDGPVAGEYILDFVVTQNSADGKSAQIAERNVYRYQPLSDAKGNKGIVLFAISVRSYGAGTASFLTGLKTTKAALVNKIKQFKVPAVVIK